VTDRPRPELGRAAPRVVARRRPRRRADRWRLGPRRPVRSGPPRLRRRPRVHGPPPACVSRWCRLDPDSPWSSAPRGRKRSERPPGARSVAWRWNVQHS